ncbi:MAG TPA: hypothetical protein VF014_03620 [Casimicrobiaceae bacterium]|nr:hypothetical protein [Casimicrobiaceae bacterium]
MSDANGQAVAYTYFRKDENEALQARLAMRSELIGLVLALIGLVSMMVVLVVAYRAR